MKVGELCRHSAVHVWSDIGIELCRLGAVQVGCRAGRLSAAVAP